MVFVLVVIVMFVVVGLLCWLSGMILICICLIGRNVILLSYCGGMFNIGMVMVFVVEVFFDKLVWLLLILFFILG